MNCHHNSNDTLNYKVPQNYVAANVPVVAGSTVSACSGAVCERSRVRRTQPHTAPNVASACSRDSSSSAVCSDCMTKLL